ncbi:MAG: hypothetical protein K2N80_08785 [Lachnospiraceae bacterium]|nr:hypothetical protein [Lachnospiraceae bacterium]
MKNSWKEFQSEIDENLEDSKEKEMSLEDVKQSLLRELNDDEVSYGKELSDEVVEKNELSKELVNKFPEYRENAVKIAFERSPEEYVEFLEKNKEALSVNESKREEGCYYFNNGVFMKKEMDDEEYAEVLRHEISHYLDDKKGWYSEQPEYLKAVYDDTLSFDFNDSSTTEYRDEMLDELFDSDVCYNRHVSDILSAVSGNNPEIILRYNMEGVPYYRHQNSYFDEGHNRENEIYADVMACISENDAETIAFIKKYFPNIYEKTKESMKEGQV